MRRILSVLLMAALLFSLVLPLTTYADETDYSMIRVKISVGDTKNSQTITLSGTYYVSGTGVFVTDGKLSITVNKDNGIVTVEHTPSGSEAVPVTVFDGSNICEILRTNSDIKQGYFSLYNTYHSLTLKYLGNLTIRSYKTSSGHYLRLINTVPMHHYLYGVVPNEMPEHYPLEALKSQAIASKGFACYKIDMSTASSIYDVRDTAQDQVYEGYIPTLVKSIEAVNATSKEALYLNGKLFPTYYSQSNGGETVTPKEAWGNSTTYDDAYAAVPDPYDLENKNSRAEMAFFPSENTSKVLTETSTPDDDGMWYSSYSKINDFLLTYARQALVASGTVEQTAVVNSINSISSMYSTTADGDTTSVDHELAHITLSANVTTDAENATSEDMTLSFTFKMSELYDIHVMTRTSLKIYNVREVEGGFAVYHRRFGHGVGLSQSSAQIMAGTKYNMTYEEILAFFYPGAKLGSFTLNSTSPIPTFSPTSTPTATPTATPNTTPVDYVIDRYNATITGLNTSTKAENFIADLSRYFEKVKIASLGNSNSAFIGTNTIVTLNGADYTIILYGDTNGDGTITVADSTAILYHIVGIEELSGAYATAADTDRSTQITAADATLTNQSIVGISSIIQY